MLVLQPDRLRSEVALTNERHSEPPRSGHLTADDIRRRAFSGSMLLGVKSIVVQGLGLASTILIAHYLTPGALGEVAFGIMLTTLVAFVGGNQGLTGALIRRQKPPDAADLETALGLQLAIGLFIAFGVTAAALPFGKIGGLTALMVWAIPVTAFRVPAQTVLERDLAYRRLVLAEVAEVVLYQIWQIATVLAGWGVWGLATAVLWRAVSGTSALVPFPRSTPATTAGQRPLTPSSRHRIEDPSDRACRRSDLPRRQHEHCGAGRPPRARAVEHRLPCLAAALHGLHLALSHIASRNEPPSRTGQRPEAADRGWCRLGRAPARSRSRPDGRLQSRALSCRPG